MINCITSLSNAKIKHCVKLRQRSHRDEFSEMLIEGYRECRRALDAGYRPGMLFFCDALYLKGEHEPEIVKESAARGAELYSCTPEVFKKMAYRERPDGLLMVGPQPRLSLDRLKLSENAMVLVAESIEKPGNLGTMLRSADASGVEAVIVCDRCTDIFNPNVVRASTGTLFTVPVAETSGEEALAFLKDNGFSILAATPHAQKMHFDVNLTGRVAIAVGTEQYGLTERWMNSADLRVRIPMLGTADSLNVAAATTILLAEAVRQRIASGIEQVPDAEPWHGEAAFDA